MISSLATLPNYPLCPRENKPNSERLGATNAIFALSSLAPPSLKTPITGVGKSTQASDFRQDAARAAPGDGAPTRKPASLPVDVGCQGISGELSSVLGLVSSYTGIVDGGGDCVRAQWKHSLVSCL